MWLVKYLWFKLLVWLIGAWKTVQEQVYDRHRRPTSTWGALAPRPPDGTFKLAQAWQNLWGGEKNYIWYSDVTFHCWRTHVM